MSNQIKNSKKQELKDLMGLRIQLKTKPTGASTLNPKGYTIFNTFRQLLMVVSTH